MMFEPPQPSSLMKSTENSLAWTPLKDQLDVPSIAPLVDGTRRGHRHHVSVTAGEIPEDMALHGELAHEEGILHA